MKTCCDNPRQQVVNIIHHFECSEQNLEIRFHQGGLICPKCGVSLIGQVEGRHFDYPGTVIYCHTCGTTCSL